jgi:Lon protease-like protein
VVPLHVFEERYRALVHRLLRVSDPAERLFGSVAIREGYEVGDHGAQSLFRVGCRMQLTEVSSNADGSFDIVAVGRDRMRLEELHTSGDFPEGVITTLDSGDDTASEEVVARALATFADYRKAVLEIRGDPHPGPLPQDPAYLSWTLAAASPLALPERQSLLECDGAGQRLLLVTELLRTELRAMRVIPSLPATEVARTRWSPN